MNKGLSTYLDALRFSAALAVFFRHLSFSNVSGGFLWQLYPFGHYAVVIFFVLSGFVIAYVTDTKEATIGEYMSARLARLYSVVLPALALTFICDFVGIRHHPQVYDLARETEPTLRLLASGLFISQSWGWQLDTLSNDAYWSLPYEFWYYILFAASYFFSGLLRVMLCGFAALIAGPGMLLVFPLWLSGVVAYSRTKRQLPSYLSARLIWIFSILLIAIVMLFRRSPAQGLSFLPPEFSPSDYILAAMVAINIWAASYLQFTWLKRFKAPIAAVASTTFSLYLMHAPLMKLVAGFVPVWWPVWIRGIIIGASTFAVILPLAHVTEKKKGALREIFSRAFLLLKPARP